MPLSAVLLVLLSVGLHAGWNLFAHSRRDDQSLFLRSATVAGVVGLLVEAIIWLRGGEFFSLSVLGLLCIAGLFQGLYFLGLTRGYAIGAFAVVYPIARGLPVLFLALIDMARSRPPSLIGWLSIGLVVAGCLLTPLDSLRTPRMRNYLNRAGFWIAVTALGTIGYTTVDKLAAELIAAGGHNAAARYGLLEATSTAIYLAALLPAVGGLGTPLFGKNAAALWRRAALAAVGIFSAYWLILWAYQLSPLASYVVALRQLSIVIGVVASMLLQHEATPSIRLAGAICITIGCAAIALVA